MEDSFLYGAVWIPKVLTVEEGVLHVVCYWRGDFDDKEPKEVKGFLQ